MSKKLPKTLVALYMMEIFEQEGHLQKEQIMAKVDMSEVSFKRYIASIRHYLEEFHPTWAIQYKKHGNIYLLKKHDSDLSAAF